MGFCCQISMALPLAQPKGPVNHKDTMVSGPKSAELGYDRGGPASIVTLGFSSQNHVPDSMACPQCTVGGGLRGVSSPHNLDLRIPANQNLHNKVTAHK
ncbi:uncharacterized [Tachysurus ichikawai]